MSTEGREQELIDWLDGTLDPERRSAMDAHLRSCVKCRAAVREMQSLAAGLGALDARRPRRRTRIRWWRAGGIAAAAVGAAGAAQLLTSPGEPALAARTDANVAARLAAFAQPIGEPAVIRSDELVRLFERETELIAQLWLLAEVARSGDAAAAQRVRAMVEEREDVPAELRTALADYLAADGGGAS